MFRNKSKDEQKIIIYELKRNLLTLKIIREQQKENPSQERITSLRKERREVYKKLYYLQNKDIQIISSRLSYLGNKESHDKNRKERLKSPSYREKIQSYQKKWNDEHKEYRREYSKEYYHRDIEKSREKSRLSERRRRLKMKENR